MYPLNSRCSRNSKSNMCVVAPSDSPHTLPSSRNQLSAYVETHAHTSTYKSAALHSDVGPTVLVVEEPIYAYISDTKLSSLGPDLHKPLDRGKRMWRATFRALPHNRNIFIAATRSHNEAKVIKPTTMKRNSGVLMRLYMCAIAGFS
jgi:hypothetical protein